MDAGLVIVLAVLGAFLLVPLWLVVMGLARLLGRDGQPGRWMGAVWMLQGFLWGGLCAWYHRQWRREQAAARSAETQIQDRAEPGRPRPGG